MKIVQIELMIFCIDKCTKAFETAFPMEYFRPNKNYMKRKPWMTTGLLTSCRTKAELHKLKITDPTDENISRYKNFINNYNLLKKITKARYYQTEIEKNKFDIKNTWKILKSAIGKHNDKSSFPHSFTVKNKSITDRDLISNEFNKYFTNIGKSTGDSVPQANKHFTEYLTNPVPYSMYVEPVEPSEVINIVNKLKNKSSYGHDGISNKLIKYSINKIINH